MAKCISPIWIRKTGQHVPCGKCNFCLAVKRADWSFRLAQELRVSSTSMFLTMTYADEHLPVSDHGRPTLVKEDCQNFMKRLRRENEKHTNEKIRFYLVGEYGTKTLRPHYHAIIFNVHAKAERVLGTLWPKGHTMVGRVAPASIHYVTKYVINRVGDHVTQAAPFALMSNRPGLGINYVLSHGYWHRKENRDFTQVNGVIARIPRYLREKIFSKLERQLIKINFDAISNDVYWKEIERLSKFHANPEAYYYEQMCDAHDRVHSKINLLDKF